MCENLPEVQEILPDSATIAETQEREQGKKRYRKPLITTLLVLAASVAAALLLANVWMPVLQIYGKSMEPTLVGGEIVVAIKTTRIEAGDIIAFDLNNKLLIKRVIGTGGDKINVAEDGTVFVNDEELNEPYLTEKHSGEPNIALPYEVAEGTYFVMGDNREKSVDSRHGTVGCVTEEQLIGKVVLRVWPMSRFGLVK